MKDNYWSEDLTCKDCEFDLEGNGVCLLDIEKPEDSHCSCFQMKEPSGWREEELRYRGEA